jgi:5-methylcytosine-specific restriction protein A
MEFSNSHNINFGSVSGAYSKVTDREYKDSQITVTAEETFILLDFFGKENILIGNVASNPSKAKKSFKLYPSGSEVGLNLNYPKPGKEELRLYLSSNAGFKPKADNIWFMFKKNNELWIGELSESQWSDFNHSVLDDDTDLIYQASLNENNTSKRTKLKEKDTYQRDRTKALAAIDAAGHQCENDNSHTLFISHATKKPYLEAHHLIPMCLEELIDAPLDVLDNIFSLCPTCHRTIHYAEKATSKEIIDNLIAKRPEILKLLNNGIEELYSYYSVEEIR